MTQAQAAAHACPRCGQTLDPATLRDVPVEVCKACKGTLLPQLDLMRTLESLSAPLMQTFDAHGKLERAKADDTRIDCPKCKRPMERDDYCAAGVVLFDRCTGCALLWFDADELGAMALMWARMNTRLAEQRQAARDATSGIVIINRRYLGSSVWGFMAGVTIADAIWDDSDVW